MMEYLSRENHKIIAALIFAISVYAAFIVTQDIGNVHQQAKAVFEPNSGVWPNAIVFAAALSPLAIATVATLVYFNKRSFAVFGLVAYGWFFIVSYASYALVGLTLIWWFRCNE